MSKMKTKRGAMKRFIKTAGGFRFKRANRNHILTKKSQKRKMHLRANQLVKKCDELSLQRMFNLK